MRILYFSALAVAVAGLLAGALLGIVHATAVSPAAHLALIATSWAGSLVPQAVFAWSQTYPEGRQLVPLWGTRQDDGWMFALAVSVLCSLVAVAVASDAPRMFVAVLFMSTTVAFTFIRAKQLRRHTRAPK